MAMNTTSTTHNAGVPPAPPEAHQRAEFQRFRIDGLVFWAKDESDGVLINPKMPASFDNTANEWRPPSHRKWWGLPYITTMSVEDWDYYYAKRTDEWAEKGREHWVEGRSKWLDAWPSGTRYEVRCLDGGAWDRSTSWGMFPTLEAAVACAKSGSGRL